MEVLSKLAVRFRQAVEEEISISDYVDVELNSFPVGSCEVTSQMFALYLISLNYENVKLTFNKRNKLDLSDYRKDSHVWIVVGGELIIDLTGDQYSDCSEPVIVSKNSKFHNSFSLKNIREVTGTCLFRPGCTSGYSNFYKRVSKRLEKA